MVVVDADTGTTWVMFDGLDNTVMLDTGYFPKYAGFPKVQRGDITRKVFHLSVPDIL